MKRMLILLALLGFAAPAVAGLPVVVAAKATETTHGWRFDVTLRHADEGWNHYADAWSVLDRDGNLLGTRTLLHPHVAEQPFTRALDGVEIPQGTTSVLIRAHDSRHGDGPDFRLELK